MEEKIRENIGIGLWIGGVIFGIFLFISLLHFIIKYR